MVPVVHILLKNSDNLALLQLRDNNNDIIFPNHWSLIGGRVANYESPY